MPGEISVPMNAAVIAAKLDAQPVIIPAWSIGDQRLKVLNCSCTAKLRQGTISRRLLATGRRLSPNEIPLSLESEPPLIPSSRIIRAFEPTRDGGHTKKKMAPLIGTSRTSHTVPANR
jgi:hypothetical protein